jgi:hypothetical protein
MITKTLPVFHQKVFVIMKFGPVFPIFGEDFTFREDFAAKIDQESRLALRDHGSAASGRDDQRLGPRKSVQVGPHE